MLKFAGCRATEAKCPAICYSERSLQHSYAMSRPKRDLKRASHASWTPYGHHNRSATLWWKLKL